MTSSKNKALERVIDLVQQLPKIKASDSYYYHYKTMDQTGRRIFRKNKPLTEPEPVLQLTFNFGDEP